MADGNVCFFDEVGISGQSIPINTAKSKVHSFKQYKNNT